MIGFWKRREPEPITPKCQYLLSLLKDHTQWDVDGDHLFCRTSGCNITIWNVACLIGYDIRVNGKDLFNHTESKLIYEAINEVNKTKLANSERERVAWMAGLEGE